MSATVRTLAPGITIRSIVFDIVALGFIFLMPAFSHMLAFPLYFIEPMRIMVILAMVHTHRNNAYLLALALPLFSFVMSGHPILVKAIIISLELMIMVGAFYLLKKYIHIFAAIFSAIILSKVFYFAVKFLIPLKAMQSLGYGSFFEFSLWIQLATSLVLSIYLWRMWKTSTGKSST
ncbi:MAG: hypothetical protein EA393_03435 [Bacteroidetes bacterium]|nr:MAG: hypothetical protein EA393_03435 [Bacteroidota bacterium]